MLKVKTIRTTHGNLDNLVNDFIEKLSKESGKYILRWDKKNGFEDLEKARVYIDKIIEGEQ